FRRRTWPAVCGSLHIWKKMPWRIDQAPPPMPDSKPLTRLRAKRYEGIKKVVMPNSTQLQFGLYGIRSMESARLKDNTLEAIRRTIRRKIKKTGRLWIMIRATVPMTKKPLGIRMGKGKGSIDHYVTPIRPGQILYEFDRISRPIALQALRAIQPKLPCRLGLVEWS
uniref:uL16m n=1 Tax=Polytomella magna TaxID=353565 RepID=UPI002240E3A4|nr:Chain Ak, uL16m [Polytomella magna]8APN_Ak Chain Ak, uL16m [Polytomella magna]8APO_Ak Chain Ak, uL16m [Polytomella magna]